MYHIYYQIQKSLLHFPPPDHLGEAESNFQMEQFTIRCKFVLLCAVNPKPTFNSYICNPDLDWESTVYKLIRL